MSEIGNLAIVLDGVGHILQDRRLRVPLYQRPYAWERANVEELLRDLGDAQRRKASEYFLGSIVTQGSEGDLEIVDGQQRLATTSIIIAGIRDYLIDIGDDRAAEIEKMYLLTKDLRTRAEIAKLTLNADDNDFYKKRVLSRPGHPDRAFPATQESHKRIEEVFSAAKSVIQGITHTTSNPADVLLDWLEYLAMNAKVIWVRVPDDFNAFVVFETLNDRGVALSIADLLKNFLFGRAGQRLSEVQQSWNRMVGALETVGGDEILLTYIRQRWSAQYGITREKELFAAIKKVITSEQAAVDFANALAEDAISYSAMLNPRHTLWNRYTAHSRSSIETLLYLRLEQYRPLLIAILKSFSVGEVERALRYMVACSVRFLISGGLGGGTLEKKYCETAQRVLAGEITTAADLAATFNSVVPTDSEFLNAFSMARVPKAYLARYYLLVLEREARGEREPEFVVNGNADEVNLEHVLPQNPGAGWAIADSDSISQLVNRLGNLALLTKTENGSIGSDAFSDKKRIYGNSAIGLTKAISEVSSWGEVEISERQLRLANLAVLAWPVADAGGLRRNR